MEIADLDGKRVRRHPAAMDDKSYVLRLALVNGVLLPTTDVEQWWRDVYEYVWILKVKDVRVGYCMVRPVYETTVVTVSGAHDDGLDSAALRSIRQGRLFGWAPTQSPVAKAYEYAGFTRDPIRSAGALYTRDAFDYR